ncbi:glycosyltransferase family 4 protein [Aquiflexum sp. TKW24L]|nr:glycosyltransferase family 4 protein [Aquiflexum sp. TKW24L]
MSSGIENHFNSEHFPEFSMLNSEKRLISPKTEKVIKIAFFDFPDVFEDFYPHYGVSQENFSSWHNTGNHGWLEIVQKNLGDVTWYVPSIKPLIQEAVHEKIRCTIKFVSSCTLHRILWKSFYLPSFAWRWQRFYRSYALFASYLAPLSFSLLKTIYKDKPDVLFVQDYCSGKFDVLVLFAKILNVPLLTLHSGSTYKEYLGKAAKNISLPKADWIFSSGNKETRFLENRFNIPSEKINIIRPPIDTNTYQIMDKGNACQNTNLDPNRRYLLFMGRFDDSVKRISAIIKAFQNHAQTFPDVDLLIIGGGKDEKDLKGLAKELVSGRVIFPGWIGEALEKSWYYNVSECLIMASWREGFPVVVCEALSCGIPVISSNVGGISDLVNSDISGWLFEPGDDKSLSEHINYVMSNPGKIKEMKSPIRKLAEDTVSFDAVEQSLRIGFESVLKNQIS